MTALPQPIQRFLDGLETGDWTGMEQHFSPDARYDCSMPGWRVQYEGPARIVSEFEQEWTGRHVWHVVEQNVTRTPDTVVIEYEARGHCQGDGEHQPHEEAFRQAGVFRLDDGRISELRIYCCGEWDEETLRRIEVEAPKFQTRRH